MHTLHVCVPGGVSMIYDTALGQQLMSVNTECAVDDLDRDLLYCTVDRDHDRDILY